MLDKLEKVNVIVNGHSISVVGGSFKGVPFFVEDYELKDCGRNVVSKPVPFTSNFVNQDLGGKIPSHPINAYLVGEECFEYRDRLISACNSEGAGELVHPFFGRFNAECVDLSVSGSRSGLNYCTVQIEFRPVAPIGGKVQQDLAGVSKTSANEFQRKIADNFSTTFSISGRGKGIVDDAVAAVDFVMNSVLEARQILATANDFVDACGKLKADAKAIMMSAADFVTRVTDVLTATAEMFGIEQTGTDTAETDEFLNLLNSLRSLESGETPAGQISAMAKNVVASMVASSLVDAKFVGVDDAKGMQTRISEAFEWLLEQTNDVDDYMAISNLESAALGYLRSSMEDMAVVLEKNISSSNNILQLCYDVYGSVDRADEIIARNGLIDCLFVLPGKIKVLSK